MMLFEGRPVEIRYESRLRDTAGNEAHAATFIPKRRILLDAALRRRPVERERILLHELFHFVWVRLGNPRRREWEELLRAEFAGRARGEAGWSAEWRKRELTARDIAGRTRRWREYCCESFCDTAACINGKASRGGPDPECTLARVHLRRRAAWFSERLGHGPLPI